MSEVLKGMDSSGLSNEVVPVSPKTPTRRKPDVFDQENFDAVAYINEMFPTGQYPPCSLKRQTHYFPL